MLQTHTDSYSYGPFGDGVGGPLVVQDEDSEELILVLTC